jgi:hypothetical protein
MKKPIQEYIEFAKSKEYMQELQNIAEKLKVEALKAPIESRFDCELFAFFRKHFEQYGFEYNPQKEYAVKTTRHVAKGHSDTAISTLVIEFKQISTLSNDIMKQKAVSQISEYLKGIKQENDEAMIEGYVTDGTQGCFVTCSKKGISVEEFLPISKLSLDRIIQNILSLKLRAFNANNLVEGFCNPPINDGIAFDLVEILYFMLKTDMQPKSRMLFTEWKELFNLSHDDISKQQAIIDRRTSLQNLLKTEFDDTDDEYLALFSLQTAYAIIIKVIAFKILSQIRFNKSLISFSETMELDSNSLRYRFENLENGDIFRDYGMTNLLEGDFFSWYCSKKQWTDRLATVLKGIFEILSGYSEKAVLNNTKRSQDFFKKLYEAMVPAAVRHSLGEYYTKKWLAQNVVEEAIKLSKVDNWKGLDPCCGSGTFLNVMIDKILYEEKEKSNEEKLDDILHRVKGIDLNPIAVLTARVNYFINISHLIDDNKPIDIPVYLGDASYVPKEIEYDSVNCYDYVVNTTMEPINITIPASMVSDTSKFAQQMISVEIQVKNQNENRVIKLFEELVKSEELTPKIYAKIVQLSRNLIGLEQKNWNGIWARILSNYMSTANLGKFDIIVGNPPWVDWKSLPSGYRDKVKSLCISRRLFSGDRLTGGINLNICTLIANVAAENWLSKQGILGFLMPEPLVFQQSYEGFRNFYMEDGTRMYFCKFTNWTKAGNPFKPVTQKFLTYFLSRNEVDYTKGVETNYYVKKNKKVIDGLEELDENEYFDVQKKYLAVCNADKNFFSVVNSRENLKVFSKIGGQSQYIGREGIEFYPQELMVFQLSDQSAPEGYTCLKNMQNKKSKYKVLKFDILLETEFLHPMIKGKNVTPFHVEWEEYIVPFPYDKENPRVPITQIELADRAPKLSQYYMRNKELILAQTEYNERIIGKDNADFYALARVGEYSYAENYVVFRDNTKWAAAVITSVETKWGGKKRPLFQNRAVSICEDVEGNYISLDEAYYICGIMNSKIVYDYMMQSSDSRSFPIRPRFKIPKFDGNNKVHKKIVKLSKEAHEMYEDNEIIAKITEEISELYMSII